LLLAECVLLSRKALQGVVGLLLVQPVQLVVKSSLLGHRPTLARMWSSSLWQVTQGVSRAVIGRRVLDEDV
jgi:hypothetical protein